MARLYRAALHDASYFVALRKITGQKSIDFVSLFFAQVISATLPNLRVVEQDEKLQTAVMAVHPLALHPA